MKNLILKLRFGVFMSRRNLILNFQNNHDRYTPEQRDIIGALFVTRFKSDEELEQMCSEVLG